jgi:hypothetical protein
MCFHRLSKCLCILSFVGPISHPLVVFERYEVDVEAICHKRRQKLKVSLLYVSDWLFHSPSFVRAVALIWAGLIRIPIKHRAPLFFHWSLFPTEATRDEAVLVII